MNKILDKIFKIGNTPNSPRVGTSGPLVRSRFLRLLRFFDAIPSRSLKLRADSQPHVKFQYHGDFFNNGITR